MKAKKVMKRALEDLRASKDWKVDVMKQKMKATWLEKKHIASK